MKYLITWFVITYYAAECPDGVQAKRINGITYLANCTVAHYGIKWQKRDTIISEENNAYQFMHKLEKRAKELPFKTIDSITINHIK